MKVCVTLPSLSDPGGVAGFYRVVLPHLAGNDVEVSTVEIGRKTGGSRFFRPVQDQVRLSRSLRAEKPQVLHVNPSLDRKSFLRDGLFIRQALRRGCAVVVFFHGWKTPFEKSVEGRLRPFFLRTYAKADAFLVLSSEVAEKLRQWGVSAPIRVTRTAVPDDLVESFSMEERMKRIRGGSAVRILFLARLERAKGIFETIDAVKILAERGRDVRLDIAGDGSAAEEVRARVSACGALDGRIRMLGYVQGESKRRALAESHIYCFPSHTEGMPLSVLEAMALGLPVVTRLVGGIKDFFQDGVMGYAVNGPDPVALADRLDALMADREAMAAMARFNSAWVLAHCRASRSAESLRDVYHQAFAGTPKKAIKNVE
jgi:glycosyltransferase involved in cell wall biosynthesis